MIIVFKMMAIVMIMIMIVMMIMKMMMARVMMIMIMITVRSPLSAGRISGTYLPVRNESSLDPDILLKSPTYSRCKSREIVPIEMEE